jgi:hypothetical protein
LTTKTTSGAKVAETTSTSRSRVSNTIVQQADVFKEGFHPNPVNDFLQISIRDAVILKEEATISGTMGMGNRIRGSFIQRGHILRINMSTLKPGWYTVTVETNEGPKSARVWKN